MHGDKYDYSQVEYKNGINKIVIICKLHGPFQQSPQSHLNKSGCTRCTKTGNYDTAEFIIKAKKIHGDKYDYTEVIYTKANSKINIICKMHMLFSQIPNDHLNGSGCPKCGIIDRFGKLTSNTNTFIEKAIKIHGDKYDYSEVNYIKNSIKIKIICNVHGLFKQMPSRHLSGSGCIKCGIVSNGDKKRITYDEFCKRAIEIHGNKYDYSKFSYNNFHEKISIICKVHGVFNQTVSKHLNSKHGCPKCTKQFSKPQIQWLELLSKLHNIYIQHAINDNEFRIPTTNFKADGYCKETNTIYEFHGDYWHGNPKIFNPNSINTTRNITFKELYENTLKRERIIKDLGYNLVVMWESEWSKINKSIKILQRKFISKIIT